MNPIGLYIHIPFCDGKCAYCSFFSCRAVSSELSEYTTHLLDSIRDWGRKLDRPVDTVYFGGGTPSLLGHERLISLLECIRDSFSVTDDAEITVEVNPTSTGDLDFAAMCKAGINRLSIGMQSADDKELKSLGRRHDLNAVIRTAESAKAGGFDNISLDVMLAIPGQTMVSLDQTLAFCADQQVRHVSCYILKIEEGTRFYRDKDKLALFGDDEQAAFYEHTVGVLARYGYRQYEISNFAEPGYEGRHNLHYWHDEEYLGLGPSAHSFIDGRRFYYDSDFQRFYDGETVFESIGGSSDEYIMLALRLNEGLIFEQYRERFGADISEKLIRAAMELQKNGLCRVSHEAISLTTKGFLVSNAIIGYLLENT